VIDLTLLGTLILAPIDYQLMMQGKITNQNKGSLQCFLWEKSLQPDKHSRLNPQN
jgi:hypothetical protein